MQQTTYSESARGVTITRDRAFRELTMHGFDTDEDRAAFLGEMGDHETYAASSVLEWLGY